MKLRNFVLFVSLLLLSGCDTPARKNVSINRGLAAEPDRLNESSLPTDTGTLTYSFDSVMKVGSSSMVVLRVTKDKRNTKISRGLSGATTDAVRVADKMAARLEDPEGSFNIKDMSTQEQEVETDDYTEWTWFVIPRLSGEHGLMLLLTIKDPDGDASKDIQVYLRHIQVSAAPWFSARTFFSNYWQFLLGTIFIPFIAFLWRKNKK